MKKPLFSAVTLLAVAAIAVAAHAATTKDSAQPAAASRFEALSDEEISVLAIKEVLGVAHEVTALRPGSNGDRPMAEGTFVYDSVKDWRVYRQRVDGLIQKENPGDGELSSILANRYCEERYLKFQGAKGPEVEKMCKEYTRFRYSPFEQEHAVKAAIRMEALLKNVKDEKTAQDLRDQFIRTFGYEREQYRWISVDTTSPLVLNREEFWGVRLKEKPLNQWSHRTVKYALAWAKDHNVSADVVAPLVAALPKAPRLRCAKGAAVLLREYEGGTTYGALRYDSKFFDPKVVDCSEAKMKSDKDHLAVLPKIEPHHDRTRWLAVKPDGDWRVYDTNRGRIGGKRLPITVYWEMEY